MQSASNRKPNRLIFEKSPYLLQHAYNPVDWYPWSIEAFRRAEDEDKPVFLSIGYSTCHWCHVMEKESFENAEVAKLLNDAFVCIKVDREERPDLDSVYMKVCQTLTGSGGWPLHIIMTPDKKPFFAATYIPNESMFGQVGMKELIPKIRDLWTSRRDELTESALKVTELLEETETQSHRMSVAEELGASTMDEAYFQLSESFDERNGGFGSAPKFPSPHNLTFLLRYWKRTSDPKALYMVEKTLKAMRLGGMYDQLGFGFHRYSTDSRWLIPHFEKMLYDQAMLTIAYTEAFQATGDEELGQTAREIISYVLRDMTDSAGGFYSAEDADSEEEGKFYLWTEEEIKQLLPTDVADFATEIFDVKRDGNFEETITGKKTGKNILHLEKSPTQIASIMRSSTQDVQKRLNEIRQRLFDARQKRVRPGKDDKILTDWNGLMIGALSKAAQVFDKPEYVNAAKRAADFILKNMRDSEERLYHRYRDGEAKVTGFLSDYAFFVWGLMELYETIFEAEYLQHAVELTEKMMEHFWDEQQGGFYLTADDADVTLVRTKEIHDGALPSGNSVAALDLIRLAHMSGETRYEQKAAQLMRSFSSVVSRVPSTCTQLIIALDYAIGPSCEVIIIGDSSKADTKHMLETLRSRFVPRKVVLLHSPLGQRERIPYLNSFTRGLTSNEGKATAYVCCNHVCNPATTDPNKMLELIDP